MTRNQKGFTLIELALALALMSFILMLNFNSKAADFQVQSARLAGQSLLQYANAVRKWIILNPGMEVDQVGSQWLKSTSCGGLSSIELLPCTFPNVTSATPLSNGSLSFTTSIRAAGVGASQSTQATITVTPFKVTGAGTTKARADLSGVTALTVAAGSATLSDPMYSGSTLAASVAPKTGVITITASARPFDEAWLRLDGKNSLHEPLVMDGASVAARMILGVNRVQALAGESLQLGAGTGKASGLIPSIGAGVIVDADIEHLDRVYAQNGVLSNGGFTSAQNALVVNNSNVDVKAGKALASKLIDADDSNYYLAPATQSRVNKLGVAGRVIVDADAVFNGLATEGQACTLNGMIATSTDRTLLSCRDLKWGKISDPPKMYRFTFTEDSTWTVPGGVTSAQVSLVGGGGSGQGWRSTSKQTGGHSGGYLYNEPLTLVPGETLQIKVGKGGISFYPESPPANQTGGMYYWYQPPAGDPGYNGYSGSSSKIISPSLGTLVECTGGSGAAMGGIDSYTGPMVAGGLPGMKSGSGVPAYPTETPLADGPWSYPGAAGACGAANRGRGNNGAQVYYSAGGTVRGGISPFGYGSGGDVRVEKWFVTPQWDTGTVIFANPGRDGVVYIDIMY